MSLEAMDHDDPFRAAWRGQAEALARRRDAHEAVRATPEYRAELLRMQQYAVGFATTLQMFTLVATRAPKFVENSFFLRSADDLASSVIMAAFAFAEGGLNVGRRELRFLLELSVQAAYVDETAGAADFDAKFKIFDRRKRPNSVDHVKDLRLGMLGDVRQRFVSHVVRSWARASAYVHPTTRQLEEVGPSRSRHLAGL